MQLKPIKIKGFAVTKTKDKHFYDDYSMNLVVLWVYTFLFLTFKLFYFHFHGVI